MHPTNGVPVHRERSLVTVECLSVFLDRPCGLLAPRFPLSAVFLSPTPGETVAIAGNALKAQSSLNHALFGTDIEAPLWKPQLVIRRN